MKDWRTWKTISQTTEAEAAAAAWSGSGSTSFLRSLSRARTHKSQAGLSLHDGAKLLWPNTEEYGMIKTSAALYEEMETWFITHPTAADRNVKKTREHCLFAPRAQWKHSTVGGQFRGFAGILITFMTSLYSSVSQEVNRQIALAKMKTYFLVTHTEIENHLVIKYILGI